MYNESEQGLLNNDGAVIVASLGFEDVCEIAIDRNWDEAHGVFKT